MQGSDSGPCGEKGGGGPLLSFLTVVPSGELFFFLLTFFLCVLFVFGFFWGDFFLFLFSVQKEGGTGWNEVGI